VTAMIKEKILSATYCDKADRGEDPRARRATDKEELRATLGRR
jgi:hypothetical protein